MYDGEKNPGRGRELRLSGGADFLVVVCGDIMTMPGLPRTPPAIGVSEAGESINLY